MSSGAMRGSGTGLNLLIYPSSLLSSGRLGKLARSLQSSIDFAETHIVGIQAQGLQHSEQHSDGVKIVRLQGAELSEKFGAIRMMLFWPLRVYLHYRQMDLRVVAAQNVYLLPLAYHLARKTDAVFAYNAHELETETIGARGFKKRISKFLERRYIRRANVVSVVNESIAEWYSTHYPGVQPVVLSNMPIDDGSSVNLRKELSIPDHELLYIHVGFLMEGRNIPLLLEVFSAHPHAHLAFLGEGYLRGLVESAAERVSNIHLLQTVPPESVVGVMRGADVGICLIEHASLSDELSTPNKLMEALAAGIPPLCSDLVEARRLLGSRAKRWILANPVTQLSEALTSITVRDIEEFTGSLPVLPSWESQAKNLVEAYCRALEHQQSGTNDRIDLSGQVRSSD